MYISRNFSKDSSALRFYSTSSERADFEKQAVHSVYIYSECGCTCSVYIHCMWQCIYTLNVYIHSMWLHIECTALNVHSHSVYISARPNQSCIFPCSLTIKQIQEIHFTYRPAQIFKILFPEILLSESDPPHKIMQYHVYYSTLLSFLFPPDRICQAEMICIGGVPVLKRHFGGAGP